MTSKVIPDLPTTTMIPMEPFNRYVAPEQKLDEEEIEKKALQTIYAELKQVRIKLSKENVSLLLLFEGCML